MEPGVPSFAVQTIPKPNVSGFGKEKPLVAYARMEFVAADSVPVPEIPVYFLAGKQDLTCSYTMQFILRFKARNTMDFHQYFGGWLHTELKRLRRFMVCPGKSI